MTDLGYEVSIDNQLQSDRQGSIAGKTGGAILAGGALASTLALADLAAAHKFRKDMEDPDKARAKAEEWNANASNFVNESARPVDIKINKDHIFNQANRAAAEYTFDSSHFFRNNAKDKGTLEKVGDFFNPVAQRSKGLKSIASNAPVVDVDLYRGLSVGKDQYKDRGEMVSFSPNKDIAVSYSRSPGGRGRGKSQEGSTLLWDKARTGARAVALPGIRPGQPEYLGTPGSRYYSRGDVNQGQLIGRVTSRVKEDNFKGDRIYFREED